MHANSRNWRTHDENQRSMLSGLLDEVGIAGALIGYESKRNCGGVTLIDGHLRKDVAPDSEWPVLLLDVDDAEADLLLATIDPIAGLAGTDREQLDSLLSDLNPDSIDVEGLLMTLKEPPLPNLGPEKGESKRSGKPLSCPECGYEF